MRRASCVTTLCTVICLLGVQALAAEQEPPKEDAPAAKPAAAQPAPAATSLLAPAALDARIVRAEPPFAVQTEARFAAIDDVFRDVLDLFEIPAIVELREEDGLARLRITAWPDEMPDENKNLEAEEPAAGILLALFLECRIVLAEGSFVEARGFEILDGGSAARPVDNDEEEPAIFELSWTTR